MLTPVRAQKRLGVHVGVPEFPEVRGFDGAHVGARSLMYSPDGGRLAVALEGRCVAQVIEANGSTRIYSVSEEAVSLLHELPIARAIELAFSPRGTFLMTWERPVKSENGGWSHNLRVWDAQSGAQVAEFLSLIHI